MINLVLAKSCLVVLVDLSIHFVYLSLCFLPTRGYFRDAIFATWMYSHA